MTETTEETPQCAVAPEKTGYLIDFQDAVTRAEADGYTVIRGTPRTLLLDLDTPDHILQYEQTLGMLKSFVDVTALEEWASKSGTGKHVHISVDREMTATERILLQACLGSDPLHEILSLVTGIWQDNAEPTVLFKPPPPKAVAA